MVAVVAPRDDGHIVSNAGELLCFAHVRRELGISSGRAGVSALAWLALRSGFPLWARFPLGDAAAQNEHHATSSIRHERETSAGPDELPHVRKATSDDATNVVADNRASLLANPSAWPAAAGGPP